MLVEKLSFDVAVWGERDPWRVMASAEKMDGNVGCFWVPETTELDSVSVLAAVASRTSRMKLGAGILNVYTRSITLIAMTATALQLISKGRFCLGVGVSTPNIIQKHGMRLEHPLSRLRGAIGDLRNVQPEKGRVGFPIYVGTIGERMCELAGELADGLLFNGVTPDRAKLLVDCAMQGAERAKRSRRDIDIRAALIFSCNLEHDRESIIRRLAYYGAAEPYNRMFRLSGFTDEAESLSKAWRNNDSSQAYRAISERMVQTLTLTPKTLKRATNSFEAVGVGRIILVPVNLEEAVRYLVS